MGSITRRNWIKATGAVGTAGLAGCTDLFSDEDEYPAQTIEIEIPFAEGGGTDLETRVIAEHLQDALDVSVAPRNEPEAGGAVLYQQLSAAEPDGYNLASFFFPLTHSLPQVIPDFDYDPEEFSFLAQYSRNTFNIMTGYDSDIERFPDLIEKAEEEGITIAFTGPVAPVAIPILQIQEELGIDMEPVFTGGGENLPLEAQAGRVDVAANTLGSTANNLTEQRTKPVVILDEPHADLIDFYEENMDIELTDDMFITEYPEIIEDPPLLTVIRGIMGPPGLPAEIQETLEEALLESMTDETGWTDQMVNLGAFPSPTPGDDVAQDLEELASQIDPYIPLLQDFAAEHG